MDGGKPEDIKTWGVFGIDSTLGIWRVECCLTV